MRSDFVLAKEEWIRNIKSENNYCGSDCEMVACTEEEEDVRIGLMDFNEEFL